MFDDHFVLLDTEYTANEHSWKNDWKGEHRELVQIGLIGVDTPKLNALWEEQWYFKPTKNPQLSSYIKELTGITQHDIDTKGVPLGHALDWIERWTRGMPIYCYGKDGSVIRENCELQSIACPIEAERFKDICPTLAPIIRSFGSDPNDFSSGNLLTIFGLKGDRAHDALNDMRNLLRVLQEFRKRGRL